MVHLMFLRSQNSCRAGGKTSTNCPTRVQMFAGSAVSHVVDLWSNGQTAVQMAEVDLLFTRFSLYGNVLISLGNLR